MSLQHILKNSSVSGKEPLASQLANGELSINYHADGPFLCCKDTAGNVRRVAGVWVSATAPSTPFPGELWLDTAITPSQLKVYKDTTDAWVFAGEVNTATTTTEGIVRLATNAEAQGGTSTTSAVTPAALQSKISDSTSTTSSTTIASSSAVKTLADTVGAALPKSGGTITGILEIGNAGQLRFEGSSNDAYETTLAVEDPTATRTITLPDRSGTVITTGDTGTVTSTMIADGAIVNADINASASIAHSKLAALNSAQVLLGNASNVPTATTVTGDVTISNAGVTSIASGVVVNADINASAAIAGTKISPDFGSQNLATTGDITIGDKIIHAGDTNTAIRFPAADIISFENNGSEKLRIDANGRLLVGTSSVFTGTPTGANINLASAIQFGPQFRMRGTHDSADPVYLIIDRARDSSVVQSGDTIMQLNCRGFDGTDYLTSTRIAAEVDGTPGANNMPGRLILSTTPSGSATPTERLRITSDGKLGLGTSSPSGLLDVSNSTAVDAYFGANTDSVYIKQSGAVTGIQFGSNRSGQPGANRILQYNRSSGLFQYLAGLNGSETAAITINNSGFVGIGTTSPASTLSVVDSQANPVQSYFGSDQTSATGRIGVGSTGNAIPVFADNFVVEGRTGGIAIGSDSSSSILFYNTSSRAERLRLDSSGRLLLGTSSSRTSRIGTISFQTQLQIETDSNTTGIALSRFTDGVSPNFFAFQKARGTIASPSVALENDVTGTIIFSGYDGTNWTNSAQIRSEIDGTPGANDMPGRLILSTTPSGSTTPTERLRIDSSGRLGLGTSSPGARLTIGGTPSSGVPGLDISDYNANVADTSDIVLSSNGVIRSSQSINNVVNTSGYFAWKIGGSDDKAGIDGSSDVMRIDSNGRLLVGTSTALAGTGGLVDQLQVGNGSISVGAYAANQFGNRIQFAKSRNPTTGSQTVVQSGDTLGYLEWAGSDGTNLELAARITAVVDGTPGSNVMPGRLILSTTPSGSTTPTERLRIDSSGTTTLTSATSTAPFIAKIGTSEVARIDGGGRLLMGKSTTNSVGGTAPLVQVDGPDTRASIAITRRSNDVSQSFLILAKTRSTDSSAVAVQEGDVVGEIRWAADDGADLNSTAAVLRTRIDGAVAENDLPGRFEILTTAGGNQFPVERFRITSDGVQAYSQSGPAAVNTTATLTVANLKTGIITSTTAAAVTMTLPTGTDTEAGFSGIYTNMTFEWSVINTGATNAVTVSGNTDHTLTGSGTVAASTSGRFASRRTGSNTFVTYRLS